MDAEELVESIARALMFLAGVVGNNWLAIRSLPPRISELRTNELLFINLAVSNLITNYLVDLPDTMADFADRWFLGKTYCGVFRFSADLSETSSIYTTFFISIYWYQKLVGSLKRGGAPVRLDSLRLVIWLLVGSWAVALAFSIPHFFFVQISGTNNSEEDCVEVYPNATAMRVYEILYLTLANAIPVAGFVYASVQIVITLLNNRRVWGNKSNVKETVKDGNKDPEERRNKKPVSPAEGSINEKTPSITNMDPQSTCTKNQVSRQADADGVSPNPSKPSQRPARVNNSQAGQVRAAKSVVAVAIVFLICWLTHLLLRITSTINTSPIVLEVASYIAASYTCIIPYIFLHGVKKLSCSCKG